MEFSWAFFWKAVKLKIVVSPQCCFSWCIMQIQNGAWLRFSYSSLLIQGLCKVLALWYNEYFFPIWLLLTFTIRPSSCWAFGWFVIISQTCTSPVCWTFCCRVLFLCTVYLCYWRWVLFSRNFQVLCSQFRESAKISSFFFLWHIAESISVSQAILLFLTLEIMR